MICLKSIYTIFCCICTYRGPNLCLFCLLYAARFPRNGPVLNTPSDPSINFVLFRSKYYQCALYTYHGADFLSYRNIYEQMHQVIKEPYNDPEASNSHQHSIQTQRHNCYKFCSTINAFWPSPGWYLNKCTKWPNCFSSLKVKSP